MRHKPKSKTEVPVPETDEQGQLRDVLKAALLAQVKAGGGDGIKAAVALGRFEGLLRSPAPPEEGQQITESTARRLVEIAQRLARGECANCGEPKHDPDCKYRVCYEVRFRRRLREDSVLQPKIEVRVEDTTVLKGNGVCTASSGSLPEVKAAIATELHTQSAIKGM